MTALIARDRIDGSKTDTANGVNVANFLAGTGNAWDCLQTIGVGVSSVAAGTSTLTQANAGLVLVDATAGNVIINLPACSAAVGALFQFKRIDASANTVTINRASADTIDGFTSQTLVGQFDFLEMRGDGISAWRLLNVLANPARARAVLGAAASGANSDITSLSALATFNGVPKRQAVLSGANAFIQIGTGLACNLLATTTPLRVSIAAGMGAQGAIDYVASHSADVASFWSGLTANVVNYLFEDRNTGTGALTGVASTLPYIAQDASVAISVVNGQHTYVYDTGQMYVGNGTVSAAVQRTAVGECLAGASTITTVTSYAKLGKYKAPLGTTIANGSRMSFNHNIGCSFLRVRHVAQFVNAVLGFSVGDQITLEGITVNASGIIAFSPSTDRLAVGAIAGSSGLVVMQKSTSSLATVALTDVNYVPQVERNF